MLLNTRAYEISQWVGDDNPHGSNTPFVRALPSWRERVSETHQARRMLLLHQVGSVKIGDVVRYHLTYTPAADRILPTPSKLFVRIRNTSALPLRAAYLHGPYNLYVAAYPSTFDPNIKTENPEQHGVPQYEPYLKAGGLWMAELVIPEDIRISGHRTDDDARASVDYENPLSVTWVIEVASQIIFSSSASVNFELLVGRDERSLDLGYATVAGGGKAPPGKVEEHVQRHHRRHELAGHRGHGTHHRPSRKGLFSRAVDLRVEDTAALWSSPALPVWDHQCHDDGSHECCNFQEKVKKQKKIHLVIITHGLHSNTGADMLFLKESIESAGRAAKKARREKRAAERAAAGGRNSDDLRPSATNDDASSNHTIQPKVSRTSEQTDDEDDEEDIMVRGFHGNAARTERGIQYLGKRLAKFILELTYPHQPYLPMKRSVSERLSGTLQSDKDGTAPRNVAHAGSSIQQNDPRSDQLAAKLPYRYTSISFVGHSLGGVIQMYAIGYIQKHSPEFFERIRPYNFVTLASPLLGLSNENPMYIKFALDFGLVGRSGQDLGLTWRAPTLARNGWAAMVGGLGGSAPKEHHHEDPGAKPLLRILPTGPAHQVLKMFRNRTVYSNVVNDGVVPLRTSCLLFLDWRGLDKVEKARRENGFVGTMAGWGWAEITGQNASRSAIPSKTPQSKKEPESREGSGSESPKGERDESTVPQPGEDVTNEDDETQTLQRGKSIVGENFPVRELEPKASPKLSSISAFDSFLNLFRPNTGPTKKEKRMLSRSQTLMFDGNEENTAAAEQPRSKDDGNISRQSSQSTSRGNTLPDESGVRAPPKTTIFESAGDILSPPLPPPEFLIDPAARPRTIFHDRIYRPEDIPPPPIRRVGRGMRSFSSDSSGGKSPMSPRSPSHNSPDPAKAGPSTRPGSSGMKVEEKIARAYHKHLSWRKVLVRLEPDAHNNMVVRRMFSNAYGWPVIKHVCDTHFSDSYSAVTRDEDEPSVDRAKGTHPRRDLQGEEVRGQTDAAPPTGEGHDRVAPLPHSTAPGATRPPTSDTTRTASSSFSDAGTSTTWDERYFGETSEDEDAVAGPLRFLNGAPPSRSGTKKGKGRAVQPLDTSMGSVGVGEPPVAGSLTRSPVAMEAHRGLGLRPRPAETAATQREVPTPVPREEEPERHTTQ